MYNNNTHVIGSNLLLSHFQTCFFPVVSQFSLAAWRFYKEYSIILVVQYNCNNHYYTSSTV